ncbi:hypothetical protein QOZ80_1BG0070800 [Eleusine coracana subsp. coracana]|nr:hypothetical protein QOZ80_1BG0070800 [Eleusine coracana subsp. coracana]
MVFDSWQEGEVFYKKYAHHVGFSVRKAPHHKGNGGIIVWKRFVCSRQGWTKENENVNSQGEKTKRKFKRTRVGCDAMIGFKRREDGKYMVARFVKYHRHQLVSQDEQHLLRSNREVSSEMVQAGRTIQYLEMLSPSTLPTVLIGTIHRLCMWHILNKLPQKLGRTLLNDDDFLQPFMACVWSSETPKEFETKWSSIISKFHLENNAWLSDKYEMRESWIPAYFVDFSLGGILRTTSRSESENAFFRHFLNRRLRLLEFWIRYETALEEQRQLELLNDNASLHSDPQLVTPWRIESHARDVYTHTIFTIFQDEVISARDKCDIQSMFQVGDERTTLIRDNSGKVREVHYNTCTKVAHCSCKLYESIGILCRHIILVLKGPGCNEIPHRYLLHRWTKTATRGTVYDANGNLLEGVCTSIAPAMKKLYSETWSKFKTGMHVAKQSEENLKYFHDCIANAIDHMLIMGGQTSEKSKVQEFESFVEITFPDEISIHPPEVVYTKGNGRRLKRSSELSGTYQTKKSVGCRSRTFKKVGENYEV